MKISTLVNHKTHNLVYSITFKEASIALDFYFGFMQAYGLYVSERQFMEASSPELSRGNSHFYTYSLFCNYWGYPVAKAFKEGNTIHICCLKKETYRYDFTKGCREPTVFR